MIRELLVRVQPLGLEAQQRTVEVFVTPASDEFGDHPPRFVGTLHLSEREIALTRAAIDALFPQLLPALAVYWKDAPPAADDAFGDGVLKRVGQLAKVARTLKLLPG